MPYVRTLPLVLLLLFFSLSFSTSKGCVPRLLCPQDINDLTIDVRNMRCQTHCDCNNQRFEGRCINNQCQATLRQRCHPKGSWKRCQAPKGSPCKQGWKECFPRVLLSSVWGDCRCDTKPPENPTETRQEIVQKEQPPDTKGSEQKQPLPDRSSCAETELCGDEKDNNCNGLIDEGCAPCVPSHTYLQLVGQAGTTFVSSHPNKPILVTASSDRTATIWDIAQKKKMVSLKGHTKGLLQASFSPSGRTIGTLSFDRTLRLWDSSSYQPLQAFVLHPTQAATSFSFHPQEAGFAATGHGDFGTLLFDQQGKQLYKLVQNQVIAEKRWKVLYAPHQQKVAVLASNTQQTIGFVEIWNIAKQPPTLETLIKGINPSATNIAFDPRGLTLVTSTKTQTQLWDLRTTRIYQRFPYASSQMVWNQQGRLLALIAQGELFLWDVRKNHLLLRTTVTDKIQHTAFLAGGKQLISIRKTGQIDVHTCSCNNPNKRTKCYGAEPSSLGKGACRAGHSLCTKDKLAMPCIGLLQPTPEFPDGIDNDCDGKTDEKSIDLSITTLTTNKQKVTPTMVLAVQVCVSNQGHLQSFTSPTKVRLYFVQEKKIDPTSQSMTGGLNQPEDLLFGRMQGGNKPICQTVLVKTPSNIQKGRWYIGGFIDFRRDYPESNEKNNMQFVEVQR